MADLEALTRIDPSAGAGSSVMTVPGQYSWRYTLPDNKIVKLGSDQVSTARALFVRSTI